MKACGLIVEYNPFHNGHQYHVNEAKKLTNADCIIAVMSGTFLQRGEPAIIDKFHRTKAALQAGVDLVVELPYAYAVQSSDFFAKGAVSILNELFVSSICFGSESGNIDSFYRGVQRLNEKQDLFNSKIQTYLKEGYSYPTASSKAYAHIGIDDIDLFQPNNILGFSYTQTIIKNNFPIQAYTIKRKNNHFHDEEITGTIASATSIRKALEANAQVEEIAQALPSFSLEQLIAYKEQATLWHDWEQYFPYLQYRVLSMSESELRTIHGVNEGIEKRLKETAIRAVSFTDWLNKVKTKRYTFMRLQRMFVHILTNTTKKEIESLYRLPKPPYVRLLGMNETGKNYLHTIKKKLDTPLITNLTKKNNALLLDEKVQQIYYSVVPIKNRMKLRKQEFSLPIIVPTP